MIPPTDLGKSYGDLKSLNHILPGIGPAYIAAVLQNGGHEVSVLDAYVRALTPEQAATETINISPDILGISLLTTSAPNTEKMIRILRAKAPKITTFRHFPLFRLTSFSNSEPGLDGNGL